MNESAIDPKRRTVELSTLLAGLAPLPAALDYPISGLAQDSRKVLPGDLFCALRGLQQHGLEYWHDVQAAGAAALVWEPPSPHPDLPPAAIKCGSMAVVPVEELGQHLGLLADRFYKHPGAALNLVGVTGTDGKTSCAYYIAQALHDQDNPCGLAGTLGHGLYGEVLEQAGLTTADLLTLRRWLADVRDKGAHCAVMEVSSHALDQQRVQGLPFAVAVLTNLGRDHLDYHPDLAHYAATKKRLFTDYNAKHCVLNLDDAFGQQLAGELGERVIAYSCEPAKMNLSSYSGSRYVWANCITLDTDGQHIELQSSWGQGQLSSRLLGRFNTSNLLAALATLLALGMPWQRALQRLARVSNAPGRMERLGGQSGQPLVVVDYAHTPQALEHALTALREHTNPQGSSRVWCVFGCGGERDPGKRPLMGAVAERLADHVIITNDNPRNEDPAQIITHIQAGIQVPQDCQILQDRAQAIQAALAQAQANDIVLVAGKGHEDYQVVGSQRMPFDDRVVIRGYLREQAA